VETPVPTARFALGPGRRQGAGANVVEEVWPADRGSLVTSAVIVRDLEQVAADAHRSPARSGADSPSASDWSRTMIGLALPTFLIT
jgi:hypothetical protein